MVNMEVLSRAHGKRDSKAYVHQYMNMTIRYVHQIQERVVAPFGRPCTGLTHTESPEPLLAFKIIFPVCLHRLNSDYPKILWL